MAQYLFPDPLSLHIYIYILIVVSTYTNNNMIFYLDFIILHTKISLYKFLNSLKYTYFLVKLASEPACEDSSIFWVKVNNLHQL